MLRLAARTNLLDTSALVKLAVPKGGRRSFAATRRMTAAGFYQIAQGFYIYHSLLYLFRDNHPTVARNARQGS